MTEKNKHRVQLDLSTEQVSLMDNLIQKLGLRSRVDLLQQAFSLFLWAVDETLAGRKIISVEAGQLGHLANYKEINLPALQTVTHQNYDYLVTRPHPWRKQLSLKGRNITVGQLMATIEANDLSDEEAAEDLDVPLAQIQEAKVYYQTHRTLIELEAQEEAARLEQLGYSQRAESESLP